MRRPLLIPFIAMLLAADAKDGSVEKEKTALCGTWQLQYWIDPAGEKIGVADGFIMFTDDRITVTQGRQTASMDYTIKATKDPKEVDVTVVDGDSKGKIGRLIYKIEDDVFTLCGGIAARERPKEFKTSKELGHAIHVFKRVNN